MDRFQEKKSGNKDLAAIKQGGSANVRLDQSRDYWSISMPNLRKRKLKFQPYETLWIEVSSGKSWVEPTTATKQNDKNGGVIDIHWYMVTTNRSNMIWKICSLLEKNVCHRDGPKISDSVSQLDGLLQNTVWKIRTPKKRLVYHGLS